MAGAKSTRRQAIAGLGAAAAAWCCGDHLVDSFVSAAPAPPTDFSPTAGRDSLVEVATGLAIHPPLLYIGYVGFSVAFAFAIAALLGGRLDTAWARWSRPWTPSPQIH